MSIDVNKAWDQLHARLADEQLLVREDAKTVTMPFFTKMKWAAAIVILCICGGAAGLYLIPGEKAGQMLSIHNNETSNTLVSTLEDGSIVYLAGGATLTCPEQFDADKRQVSLQGEAMFDVQSDQTYPFLVETKPVVVEVLGTAFNIKSADNESFELSVQRGLVKVTPKFAGESLLVKAGETVYLQSGRQLTKISSDDRQQFAQYTERMWFKDARLDDIVRVINKISDIPVTIADSTLSSMKMTIGFDNNTPADMVHLMCIALGLKYVDNGNHILIESSGTP